MVTTYKDPGGAVDPDVRKTCAEIVKKFAAIPNVWGYSSASTSDHRNRRCIDYMVIGQKTDAARLALGNAIAKYHIDNAKRLGVNGLIWNHRVMGFPHATNPPYRGPYASWRSYSGSNQHTDHVHVEYDGSPYIAPPGPKLTEFDFAIAQWNVLNPAWADEDDLAWSKRLPLISELLKKASASVVLLNECTRDMAAAIQPKLGNQWEWDRVGVNAVFRDKTKWPQTKLIEKTLPGNGTRTLVAVDLKRAGTTVTLRFGALHLETLASGYAKTEAEAQKLRDSQMTTALASLGGGPAIRIFGGDLNDSDDLTGPRAIARKAGYKTLDDLVTVKNAGIGTTDSRKQLDEIFVRNATVTSAEVIDGGKASDHNLTRASIHVKW